MRELAQGLVGKLGKEKVGKAGPPGFSLGKGNGLTDQVRGGAVVLVTADEGLLDGDDACSGDRAARGG